MPARSHWFWFLWLVIVLGAIWFFARETAYGWQGPSQGDGARALRWVKKPKAKPSAPPMPKAIVVPPQNNLPPVYFACTATDTNGLTSINSNVVGFTNNFTLKAHKVTLAWDFTPSVGITNYTIHSGRSSATLTNAFDAGLKLTLTVPLNVGPTNLVLTITSINCTNLLSAPKLSGPWTMLGATNWTGTNQPYRFWRGLVRKASTPGQVFTRREWVW